MATRKNIGPNFVLFPYFGDAIAKMETASVKATKQATIIMERSAKINTPFRTGTNSRSIISEAKGKTGIVKTTSKYGFWLEVVDRIYQRGHKGYLRGAFKEASEAYPGLVKKAFASSPVKFRPRPRI